MFYVAYNIVSHRQVIKFKTAFLDNNHKHHSPICDLLCHFGVSIFLNGIIFPFIVSKMADVLPERFILVLMIVNSACKGLPTGSPYGIDGLPCNYETKLTENQMSQVESTLDRIESASDPLSGIPRLQLPMISLEDFQENYILSKYG